MKKLVLFNLLIVLSLITKAQSPESFTYQAVVRDLSGAVLPDQNVGIQISILQGALPGTSVYSETYSLTTNGFGLINLAVGSGAVVSGDISTIDWSSGPYYLNVGIDITGGTTYTDMGTVQLLSVPFALYAKTAANGFSGNYNDLSNAPDFTGWDQDESNDFSGNYNDLANKPVLAGDVTGQTDANTVTRIQGMDVSTNMPANGQVLKWNNSTSTWEPSDDQLGAAGTTDGVVTGAAFTGTTTKTLTLIRSNGLGDITAVFTDMVDDADADPSNEIQNLSIAGNNLTISGGNTVTLPAGTTYTAGSGININGSNQIINTSPDQAVTITGSGATTVTGTYPNFSISSTDNNTTYTAGSGLSLTGTTFANTAPDQAVSITGSGATTVTGTYPNFTVSSTDNNTITTASAPLSISAGNISILTDGITASHIATGAVTTTEIQDGNVTSSDLADNSVIFSKIADGVSTGQVLKYNATMSTWELGNDNSNIYTAGSGLALSGTQFSLSAPVSVANGGTGQTTYTNGQLLIGNATGNTLTKANLTAGSGIGINNGPGTISIINTSPDQTVTLLGGGSTSISGTYPTFTISSTDNNTTYTAGSGLALTGNTFSISAPVSVANGGTGQTTYTNGQLLIGNTVGNTLTKATLTQGPGITITNSPGSITVSNTAPDQTVSLTGIGATSVSGTYPNFTISSTDNNTTYTAGTGLTLSGTTFNSNWTTSGTNIYNNNTGYVGIGNTSPAYPLHVYTPLTNITAKIGYNSTYFSNRLLFGDNEYVWVGEDGADDRLSLKGTTMSLNIAGGGGVGTAGQVLTSDGTLASWQTPAGAGMWLANGSHIYNGNSGNVGVGVNSPNARLTVLGNSSNTATEPLFEVKNRAGQTVFIIYEDSVRIYIDDDPAKTNKGAFAVSGRNTSKAFTHDFFLVKPEFSRVYTSDPIQGFGVQNINGAQLESYMKLNPYNYLIGHNVGSGMIVDVGNGTGVYNCVMGYEAARDMTSGADNVIIGYRAGLNQEGRQNVILGSNAGIGTNTTYTTMIGSECGQRAMGDDNVYIGYQSGMLATSENNFGCVFLGNSTGYRTWGTSNVILGNGAGANWNTSQLERNYNIFIGELAGTAYNTMPYVLHNNILIGYRAGTYLSGSYKLIIENSDNITNPLIAGDFNTDRIAFNRPVGNYPLQVGTDGSNGNGAFLTFGGVWTAGSSRTFKDRYTDLNGNDILNKIAAMELKGWYYKGTEEYHIGPFAEDFYQAFGCGDKNIKEDLGKYLSATDVAGVSIVAIQQLVKELEAQKKINEELLKRIEALEKK